ncbi:glycoside hydrolase [Clavulina sp. PMI_390]|nr:glycoside hydrolase [Clavulina sp. PMI_390]
MREQLPSEAGGWDNIAVSDELSRGWQWCQRDTTRDLLDQSRYIESSRSQKYPEESKNAQTMYDWRNCAEFPTEIHVELMEAGLIPDPRIGFNEHRVQWIGDQEWLFRRKFDHIRNLPLVKLVFEGLDTFCDVYLNDRLIVEAQNQFRPYTIQAVNFPRISETDLLKTDNVLVLHFKSAKQIALDLEKKYGTVRAGSVNLGHPSRVYARKAQYDWRWDWGPELMTVGPYRPIRLDSYNVQIANIHPIPTVSFADGTTDSICSLRVKCSLDGHAHHVATISVSLRRVNPQSAQDSSLVHETTLNIEGRYTSKDAPPSDLGVSVLEVASWSFAPNEVDLWWPVGYGEPVLYELTVELKLWDGKRLDLQRKRFGFRTAELVQQPFHPTSGDHSKLDRHHHGEGTSFYFRINGVPMFMGGSNWIPADNFLTTMKPNQYRAWLNLLKDGNQNMIRAWGGGIYEPEVFYDTCDELGILVWQDFQFACGVYPAHDEFVANVRAEAEANVIRLRHHPSIVLWCGNNEDYQQVLQWGDVSDLPAKLIYEEVLPAVISNFTEPVAPYHRGSPYGGKGWDTSDPTVGDIHQWEVWAGGEAFWQNYDLRGGRFVSEFGIPSFPDRRTIEYWLEDGQTSDEEKQKLRYAQSKSMQQHNKAGSHERRFAILMSENFRFTADLDEHIYNTQLLQSEALGFAYRSWRREWRGPGREYNAGALVWQLNDCWPVISWAIADYFMRPKPAYYAIKRELAPITVGMQRKVEKNRSDDRPRQFYEFGAFQCKSASLDLWATNSTLQARRVTLRLEFFDLNSDWKSIYPMASIYTLAPNSSTEILSNFQIPEPPSPPNAIPGTTMTYSVVVCARIYEAGTTSPFSELIARASDWPQPFRLLDLPDPAQYPVTVKVKLPSADANIPTVSLLAPLRPVKGVVLSVDGADQDEDEVRWSDNGVDLIPGEEQVIIAKGLKTRRIRLSASKK